MRFRRRRVERDAFGREVVVKPKPQVARRRPRLEEYERIMRSGGLRPSGGKGMSYLPTNVRGDMSGGGLPPPKPPPKPISGMENIARPPIGGHSDHTTILLADGRIVNASDFAFGMPEGER